MVADASLVCTVLSSRWPVCAAWSATSAVSKSRISPTRMMLGSCRRIDRRPFANVIPERTLICVWLMPGNCSSIGSSSVRMLFFGDLTEVSAEYSVRSCRFPSARLRARSPRPRQEPANEVQVSWRQPDLLRLPWDCGIGVRNLMTIFSPN